MHSFITGTDTSVGKTYVTAMLLRGLRDRGDTVVGYKPVCTGGRDDAMVLEEASSPGASLDEINPIWFRAPLSPVVSARIEHRPVNFAKLVDGFDALAARFDTVLVEGAGGLETPLTNHKTVADLAKELSLPVIVVVNNRLGALNHTILTVRALHSHGLTCRGIILNCPDEERDAASISNRAVLTEFLDVPILAEIMHDDTEMDISFVVRNEIWGAA